MVVGDLDIVGIAIFPAEADSPMVIDPDAPLTGAIAGKLLQPIAGRDAKKVEGGSGAELFQLALGDALHILGKFRRKPAVEKLFGFFAGEGFDHRVIVTQGGSIVKR